MPVPLRIGVFGGTFNPIHVCHLHIAARVLALLALDRVVFVPASVPPHKAKEDLAPAHHRLEMVRLALSAAFRKGHSGSEIRAAVPGDRPSVTIHAATRSTNSFTASASSRSTVRAKIRKSR